MIAVGQRLASFLCPREQLCLRVLNIELLSVVSGFPKFCLNTRKLSQTGDEGVQIVLRLLARRRTTQLELNGALPVSIIADIIDVCSPSLQRIVTPGGTLSGPKMVLPHALKMEDKRLLEQSIHLAEKYSFVLDLAYFDNDSSTIFIVAREEFALLKKDATAHYTACFCMGAVPCNFATVVGTCDKMIHEISCISGAYSYFMAVVELSDTLDVLPLSTENIKRELLRWDIMAASFETKDDVHTMERHYEMKYECWQNVRLSVDEMMNDFRCIIKILNNSDDAFEALSLVCENDDIGPVNRDTQLSVGKALKFWKSQGESLESISNLVEGMKKWWAND
jgi:hypothetical protein